MEPISIAMGLAQFVPGLVRWFKGDRAGDIAQTVVDAAKGVAGVEDPQAALSAIGANAELQVKLQQALAPVLVAEYEAETRRLETINATMRTEALSGDAFTRRWRPTLGYVVTGTWGTQMLALSWLIISNPDKAVAVMTAMAGLSMMWGIALSVLGIGVSARSRDKSIAAGHKPEATILSGLAQRLGGGT